MKLYLYDSTTGIFEGEVFEESHAMGYVEGITNIAPPSYNHGQVAVFNRQKQVWEILATEIARQLLKLDTP